MSQRTHGRTTGAGRRSQPEDVVTPPVAASAPRRSRVPKAAAAPVDPAVIARTLRAVADELERDPALASRVAAGMDRPLIALDPRTGAAAAESAPRVGARRFQARLVTGVDASLGPGIPDPFALFRRLGAAGLAAALADLRLGGLRAIIRKHRLDPEGRMAHVNDAERLRGIIRDAAARRGE